MSSGEPEYRDKHIPKEPKGQVVFTTTFLNDTNGEHEYSFSTSRTTKSTCEIEMSKGVTNGAEVELTLKTPLEVRRTMIHGLTSTLMYMSEQ